MKIQLLNPSELKIIFNLKDLEENNISLHSFLSGSEKTQNFLKAIIEIAHEDFGFEMLKQNFSYETFCFNYYDFVIIVSTHNSSISNINLNSTFTDFNKCKNISRDNSISSTSSFNFVGNKLKSQNLDEENLFFFFSNIEDFFEFSDYIKSSLSPYKVNSFLYQYKDILLLEIKTSNLSSYELEHLLIILSETKTNSEASELVITRFKEFSDLLISDNALNL